MNPKNFELVKRLRHELHQNPEPSNFEVWTKNHIIEFLVEHTSLEIVDRGKWFYAVYHAGKDKPNIAFRADFDALRMDETIELPYGSKNKGVSHKCGHDGHSASLAGFALEIHQNGSDKNIFFLFQHAEETGDGAAEAKVFIKENKIEEIFAFHNRSGEKKNTVITIDGTSNFASRGMIITMIGKPTHASQPEFGINPAFGIAKIVTAIPSLTHSDDNQGMVLCTVIQVDVGERSFGIAASRGELLMTIRAELEDELDKLQEKFEEMAKNIAIEEGLEVSFEYNDVFPMTYNHKESSDKIRQAARNKGLNLIEKGTMRRGSEDFGHYLKETKGALCYIANGEEYPELHTTGYDFPDEIIKTAVELFKGIAEL